MLSKLLWGGCLLVAAGLLLASGVGWYLESDGEWVTMPVTRLTLDDLEREQEKTVTLEIGNDRWWPVRIVGLAQC
ncbi:MAG TPA: hypothetical protein PKD86_16800 [Gemmatales bacterium]|nr:hypothetical protein [Gemmatales bacterium]HMP61005.1 hypothetical protein [Gemmatales bacterium]